MVTKYVAYYRVSTKGQGESGLGLEAQQKQVRKFVKHRGGVGRIVQEFIEVESGKKNDRPQLTLAIAESKAQKAKLVIAKLDRLSRNAGFIFALRDSQVDFVCADMPDANSLTIGIMAVLAQDERERISQRTKAALAAKKAQGAILGKPENLTEDARAKGLAIRKSNALENKNSRQATELLKMYRQQKMTYADMARKLNDLNMKTRRGSKFLPMTVKRLLDRADRVEAEQVAHIDDLQSKYE